MAKEPEKKALKAIDKAVRKAIKSGISGGLVDQTVAASIHAATVKAARKAAAPQKNEVKLERARLGGQKPITVAEFAKGHLNELNPKSRI
jgi:hypothetical protein